MFESLNFDVDRYLNRVVPRPRLYLLPKPISWFLGYRAKPIRPVGNVITWFWACIGAFCGLLVVEAVFKTPGIKDHGSPVVIASLGAAAILEYNTIASPLAAPRNAILGQVFSALIGVGITKLFQLNSNFENLRWIAGALSVGVASAVMGITNTVHPPAGATALLASTTPDITALGWFLVPLILLGSTLMVAVACALNNIQRQFPLYWWTATDLSQPKADDVEKSNEDGNSGGGDTLGLRGYKQHGKTEIVIEKGRIHVPGWMSLDEEERSMLETLRSRLEEKLRITRSLESDDTQVEDSS